MNLKERKNVMSSIIYQLEQEYTTKHIPEKEVFEIGHEEAEIDNMSELVTEMLAMGHIFRPAMGMLALTRKTPRTGKVKVVVTVERDGEEIRRVSYDNWLDTLTIKEIIETISDAIGSIDEI